MGMMLRRKRGVQATEPTVNGKPVAKQPKRKKLGSEPKYPEPNNSGRNATTINDLIRR